MIAKSKAELSAFAKAMNEAGFKQSEDIAGLFKFPKTFLTVNQNAGKDIYDFVVQYPSGQVEIFDKNSMASKTLSPEYNNSAVVLLAVSGDLEALKTKGFDLMSNVGPVFRL